MPQPFSLERTVYPFLKVTHPEGQDGQDLPESLSSQTLQPGQWRGPLSPESGPSVVVEAQSLVWESQEDRGAQPAALELKAKKVVDC